MTAELADPVRDPRRPRWSAAWAWAAAWCVLGGCLLAGSPAGHPRAPAPEARAVSASASAPASAPRTKAIEEVRAGDLVLARDGATGELAPRRVVEAYRRTSDHLRVLTVRSSDGSEQELRTTDEHPFWAEGRGWVAAGELGPGQRLRQSDGAAATLTATRREGHPGGVPVFNFQVEQDHNYHVAQNALDAGLLVHNANYKVQDVDITKLIPPPGSPFADPNKLRRHGPFDWSKYTPIVVETDGRRLWLMNGMTRVENALRAGITILPAQVFKRR